MYNLIIDDIRDAKDCYLHRERQKLVDFSGVPAGLWDIVRNYDQFIFKIKKYGVPLRVSFDNDLCQNHMLLYIEAAKSNIFEYEEVQPKMGVHALQWLLDFCKKEEKELPIIYIHTANYFARFKMREMLGLESHAETKSEGGVIIS